MTILSRNDQKGRSMVEMLGVLAIIGVLSVGGISGYSKAMSKFKLTKSQDQITMLLMNVRTAFAASPNYDGLTTTVAIQAGIAPNDMYTTYSATKLNNAFGGNAHIYACDETGGGGHTCAVTGSVYDSTQAVQYFAISLDGLGRETCMSLAASDWGTDGLVGMNVGKDKDTSTGSYSSFDMPISLSTAATVCANKENTITWVYY